MDSAKSVKRATAKTSIKSIRADPLTTLPILFTTLASDYDLNSISENIALRYTKIPFTALFAEARAQQQSIGQSDFDVQPGFIYGENPDYANQVTDLRFGFNTSPWRQVNWSAALPPL